MNHIKSLVLILLLFAMVACQKHETIVVTEQFSMDDMIYLNDAANDSLVVSIQLEYPTQLPPDSVCEYIQNDLKAHLFGEAFTAMEPQQAMEAYIAMLKTEYKLNFQPIAEEFAMTTDPSLFDEFSPILCEEQILNGTVMGIVHDIMSYGIERYVYTGGAHGNNFRLFINYDLKNGKKLTESDIFKTGYQEPLTELLLKNMVAQNDEVELIKDLELAGYNVDDIHPNDNFYLAEEGITYVFNPYDIAPYALGETEILIPWDDITPLLNDFVLGDNHFSIRQLF